MVIDESLIESFRKRYNFHPLILHRSIERTTSVGELFDVLESFPDKYPVIWNEEDRRWVYTNDLVLTHKFEFDLDE